MEGRVRNRHTIRIDSAGVFLLGAVFLFLSIGIVMLGGSVYRSVMQGSNENDQIRTTFSYIANQVRRADSDGGVGISQWADREVLLLNQNYGGYAYVTYLYHYDGALRELFVEKGVELELEAGLPIVWIEGIHFQENGQGLISIQAVFNGGKEEQMLLSTRSSAGSASARGVSE